MGQSSIKERMGKFVLKAEDYVSGSMYRGPGIRKELSSMKPY